MVNLKLLVKMLEEVDLEVACNDTYCAHYSCSECPFYSEDNRQESIKQLKEKLND